MSSDDRWKNSKITGAMKSKDEKRRARKSKRKRAKKREMRHEEE